MYKIYEEESEEYSFYGSSGYLICKGDYAKIFNKSKEKEIYIRHGKMGAFWTLSKTTYLIDFVKEKTTLAIKCNSYIKGHWTFNLNDNAYDFYLHSTRRKSLYKNLNRVARYTLVDNAHIIDANDDEDKLLLISLCIAFNMGDSTPDSDIMLDIHKL